MLYDKYLSNYDSLKILLRNQGRNIRTLGGVHAYPPHTQQTPIWCILGEKNNLFHRGSKCDLYLFHTFPSQTHSNVNGSRGNYTYTFFLFLEGSCYLPNNCIPAPTSHLGSRGGPSKIDPMTLEKLCYGALLHFISSENVRLKRVNE